MSSVVSSATNKRKPLYDPIVDSTRLSGLQVVRSPESVNNREKRFRIGSLIARGGGSSVFRGIPEGRASPIALKVFDPNAPEWRIESARLQALGHTPHVVKMREHFQTQPPDSRHVITMDYLDGPNLRQMINDSKGPLTSDVVFSITRQILEALEALREKGVIHADIKPANVVYDRDRCLATLCDFGISVEKTEFIKSCFVQTRWYRAPEVFRKEPNYTAAIDMWSLGCLLYEVYVGEPLFPSPEIERDFSPETTASHLQMVISALDKKGHSAWRQKVRDAAKARQSPHEGEEVIQFIESMLQWDPAKRITPAAALHNVLLRRHVRVRVQVTDASPHAPEKLIAYVFSGAEYDDEANQDIDIPPICVFRLDHRASCIHLPAVPEGKYVVSFYRDGVHLGEERVCLQDDDRCSIHVDKEDGIQLKARPKRRG